VAEAVAEVGGYMREELDMSSGEVLDVIIEDIIRELRRASSMLPGELEEEIYGYRLDEGTDEKADTA
jgi:hypothetical protein